MKMAGGGGGGGGGRSGGGCGQSHFLEALDKSQSRRDGGFKNNWSFDHSEESEGGTEKDEASLLSVERSDGTYSPDGVKKTLRYSFATFSVRSDSLRTYTRRNKIDTSRMLKGNPVGPNTLGSSRKSSENVQNMSCSGTVGQTRRCLHAHAQTPVVKTAAQRKEYPANISKIDHEFVRFSRPTEMKSVIEKREESGSESNSGITRKEQLKRHCPIYQSGLLPTPATKKCAAHLEGSEQNSCPTICLCPGKANESQTKCSICGKCCIAGLQRQSVQNMALNDTLESLAREPIHENLAGHKSLSTGLNAKKFYGSSPEAVSLDLIVRRNVGPTMLRPNGKNCSKLTGNVRQRNTTASELNDPIVLSSDDEEENEIGSNNRMESISPRPADSACSSPAPSTGKVEAALKENTCELQQRLTSITADSESAVTLPRKARMKDQFGNVVSSAPVKRRKVTSQEIATDVSLKYQNSCESVILHCRSIRIGTLRRMVAEPVIFCLDYIKINLEESENDTREINLKTSELTKCEWCGVRKLPVVFLQTIPAACQTLRSHLKMNKEKDNVWYDCKGANPEEQYIILIFETGLDAQANAIFEKIISDIGVRNSISNFFMKITFEEANSRLVAFTKSFEDTSRGGIAQKEGKAKHVVSESKMQLRNSTQFQFFDDDESGEPHTVFIGPIEKLIVYPPPPAKGGISVTNEDLHCLNEGEFLNDVIIDFYLKYLVLERLKQEDADRIHVFSSFFYKRLNQRERRNPQETSNLTLQQKRHGRVKTWTRHVDIFEKDFIFVPLNEAAHWFLAVICFPGLKKPIYETNPYYQENSSAQVKSFSLHQDGRTSSPLPSELDLLHQSPSAAVTKKALNKKHVAVLTGTSAETEESESLCCRRSPALKGGFKKLNLLNNMTEDLRTIEPVCHKHGYRTSEANGIQCEQKTHVQVSDSLQKIRLNYSDDSADSGKINEDELIDFSEDQDNQDNSSGGDDDDDLGDDHCNSELGQWHLKPTICKQPCILLMDSLRGPSRSNVVRTLREYLQVEWEVRKGSKRSFSKDVMKGSNPKVPQQNNFSDCGVYVLQYVESFFETPIVSFELPMNLTDWFPRPRMKTKREEIRKIILKLQEQQNKEKKGQKDSNLTEKSFEEGTEQFIKSCSD
ncbi:sentrin-specific protease 6 isoform X2 [Anolis carolinensis]|uniref:Sentrin-specific protease 6 n=1 Tax=Anolis carolinensis TaxID=28377 RepID=G1KDF3_ANOCA|nr:PREDICTED: sentrin-specific protease 6 isoform X2 [Anolis carolinensis]|eukprot:XP_008120269.1 PREDICTED: sentrin-specific protease 6 isoform X2 [Anolis carolinensis]